MPKTYLTPEDARLLEDQATCMRDQLLIRLLSRTGCRISEALGLTVEDVDLRAGTICIQHLKTRIHIACTHCNARLSKTSSFCAKCGLEVREAVAKEREHKRMRTLPVDPETVAMLREFIARGGPIEKNSRKLLFPITRTHAWRIIRNLAEKADLGKLVNPESGRVHGISPHRLRDLFAIHAMKTNDSGDGLRLLQEHLGHTSFDTTARYRKVAGEEHREWYQGLWGNGDKPPESHQASCKTRDNSEEEVNHDR